MKVSRENSQPKYLQLKDMIRHYLEVEGYQTDQKIPTEHALSKQFRMSRGTVRQALSELVEEGVIYKRKGSGSFFSGTLRNAQKRSGLIGVITPISRPYVFHEIIEGINEVARQKHYNIVLTSSNNDPEKELACLEQLLNKDVDGVLLDPSGGFQHFEDSKNFHLIKSLTNPVVFMDWAIDDPDISYVALDNVAGGFRATSHFIEAGHTRIACIYTNDFLPSLQRYQGYRKALEVHGIEHDQNLDKSMTIVRWYETDAINKQTYTLVKELLNMGDKRPTAIFFNNDEFFLHGYPAIREAGLKIPDDLSVIGYDDTDIARMAEVPLTSVIYPKYQTGKWAAELLFDHIEQGEHCIPRHIMIPPTIAVRDSVKVLV